MPRVLYLSGYHTLFDSLRVPPHIPTYDIQPPREDTIWLVLLLGEHTSYYRVYPGWGSHQITRCLADPEAAADNITCVRLLLIDLQTMTHSW
jgi:hypothetical protein